MKLERSFSTAYECELANLGPALYGQTYHFGPGSELDARARDGLLVAVHPNAGAAWVGRFQFGDIRLSQLNAIQSHPNPNILCVIARGNGYLVDSRDPSKWELALGYPITRAIPVVSCRLLLLANVTTIAAYGPSGLVWESDRLSWDRFSITKIDGWKAWGAYDDPDGEERTFQLDLSSGERTGIPIP